MSSQSLHFYFLPFYILLVGAASCDVIQGKEVNICSSVQAEITMPNRCVAYGCSNTTNVEGITTYYFPKDISLKKKWIAQVKRTRDKWSGPTAHSVLCCNHFDQDCFEEGFELGIKKRRKLKENAIPTIFKRHQHDNDSDSRPKRKAYEKREQIRVMKLHNQHDYFL